MSTFSWPHCWPHWVTAQLDIPKGEVRITVTLEPFSYSWEVPRGEATSRDTLRIAQQVYLGLKDKKARLDRVTQRITQK